MMAKGNKQRELYCCTVACGVDNVRESSRNRLKFRAVKKHKITGFLVERRLCRDERLCVGCGRWWEEYSDRKNDEEDEHVADSLLYDRNHLPRTAPPPECVHEFRQQAKEQAEKDSALLPPPASES
jgi:hypothetical protein